ncbi:hypothetical protein D3C71_1077230 [compost metagenome]
MVAVTLPIMVKERSAVEKPFTRSLKVTSKVTEVSAGARLPIGTMLMTAGSTPSMTRFLFALSEPAAPGDARIRAALLPAASVMAPPARASEVLAT